MCCKEEIVKGLRCNPVFQMSLSGKELFHSNFLYWIAVDTNTRNLFADLLVSFGFKEDESRNIVDGVKTEELEVLREYNNFDFCIKEKGTNKVLFVLENKFKSIPYRAQLHSYEEKIKYKEDGMPKFVLLSLAENVPELGGLITSDEAKNRLQPWKPVTYCDYIISITESLTKTSVEDCFTRNIIEHYCQFVTDIISLFSTFGFNTDLEKATMDVFSHPKELKEVRMDDIWQKIWVNLMAAKIAEGLSDHHVSFDEISNIEVGTINIGTNYSREAASVTIVKKLNDKLLYGVQVQDLRYRHVWISLDLPPKWMIPSNSKSLWIEDDPNIFSDDSIFPQKGTFNKFGNNFIYQYKKINLNASIKDVVNYIVDDIMKTPE